MVPALLKWIGNKQRFAEYIVDCFPESFRNYHEPYLGSGAVLAELSQRNACGAMWPRFERAYASDALPFLVDIFQYVKDDPDVLCDYYQSQIDDYYSHPDESYSMIRDRFNSDKNCLDFCLLTRTCYSGIVRFRKKDGFMSTPKGPHKPISPESFRERVYQWHNLVQNVDFDTADYREAMSRAKKGDLVYCDPPYTHSQSIIYGAQDFSIDGLWDAIADCKSRGVYVALSINGYRKSKSKNISPQPPDGVFAREIIVNCGTSMIDRLQQKNHSMPNDIVHDKLLLTWN